MRSILVRLRRARVDPAGLGRELLVHFPHMDPATADGVIGQARVDLSARVRLRRTTLISR